MSIRCINILSNRKEGERDKEGVIGAERWAERDGGRERGGKGEKAERWVEGECGEVERRTA